MLDEMLQRMYDFTLWVVTISQRFAKVHKYSLGVQLENACLECIKNIVRAKLMPKKDYWIKQAQAEFHIVKVYIRMALDMKVISTKQYAFAIEQIAKIDEKMQSTEFR
jgi:hypothetical protein